MDAIPVTPMRSKPPNVFFRKPDGKYYLNQIRMDKGKDDSATMVVGEGELAILCAYNSFIADKFIKFSQKNLTATTLAQNDVIPWLTEQFEHGVHWLLCVERIDKNRNILFTVEELKKWVINPFPKVFEGQKRIIEPEG